jgi:hypothetical protein
MEIPKKIRQAIKENRLVVFAGSGLSLKFGLPNWSKLVRDVISEIDIKKYNSLVTLMEDEVMTPMEILEKLNSEHSDIKRYIIGTSHYYKL